MENVQFNVIRKKVIFNVCDIIPNAKYFKIQLVLDK